MSSLRSLASRGLAAMSALMGQKAVVGNLAPQLEAPAHKEEPPARDRVKVIDTVTSRFWKVGQEKFWKRKTSNHRLSPEAQDEIIRKAEAKRQQRMKRPNGWSAS